MGLQECANTHVDDWHLRGFGGGEKCHLNSVIEILTHPHLLFLDEPNYSTNKIGNFGVVGLYCLLVLVVANVEETSAIVTTT
jgi:ABC-type phosphonate transport system ATPase subunit